MVERWSRDAAAGAGMVETAARAEKTKDVFGISEPGRVKRSPEEVADLKRKVGLIARVFSRTYEMEVYPSPEGGWACGIDEKHLGKLEKFIKGEIASADELPPELFKPRKIYYDLRDVEGNMTEDQVLGVIRHEVGHANHTDYKNFFKGQRQAREEGYLPSSWAGIWNALEDPWVNNQEISGSDVVREKIAALYDKWKEEVTAKINTQPATHQLGLNLIHHWLTGESISTLKDEQVKKVFEQMRPHAEEYFRAPNAAETDRIMRDKIWPLFKPMEEKAREEEQTKEAMRNMSGSKLGGEGGGQGKGGQRSEQEEGVMQKLKDFLGLGGGGKPSSKPGGDKPGGGAGDEQLREAVSKEMKKQEQAARSREEQLQQAGNDAEELSEDIDLSEVPPDLLEKIKEAISQLPPEERKELEEAARKQLDKKQSEAFNRKTPKTIQMKEDKETGEFLPTMNAADEDKEQKIKERVDEYNQEVETQEQAAEAERSATEAGEQQAAAAHRREQDEKQQLLREGFDSADLELYRKFKTLERSMEGQIGNFMRVLDRYLPKKEETEYGGDFYSGAKLDSRNVIRRAPTKDYRMFKRREVVESGEPRLFIELLIDNSGSMAGAKMEESVKTAIFFARVLKRFEIPCRKEVIMSG